MAILSSLFVLVVLFIVYRYLKWFVSPLRKIPGPFGLPIFGNLVQMLSSEPGTYVLRLIPKYGKVFLIFFLTTPQVVVADPHLIKYVMNNPDIYGKKGRTYKDLAKLVGNGLPMIGDQKYHKYQRSIITNAFSYANLKLYFPVFIDKATKLSLYLSTFSSSGQTVNIQEALSLCTTEIIGRTVFASEFNCLDSENGETDDSGKYLYQLCKGIASFKFNLLDYIFRDYNRRKAFELSRKLNIEMEKIIEKKLNNQNPSTQRDLLDLLLELKNEKGESLSRSEVIDNCKLFLLAGTDTAAVCMSWTIWFLCQYPEIQERLHNEIVAKIGNSVPTFEQIESIPYLNNVVRESLRIRPPVGSVMRLSEHDDYLGDYFIPKGTHVFIHMNSIQNNPDIWKNPTAFDPDRWNENENENDNDENENQKLWIPFLLGVRSCIGSRFALLEIKAILCILLTKYTFSMPSSHPPVKRGFGLVSKLLPYLKVKIENRK